jgi:hypothetical protein
MCVENAIIFNWWKNIKYRREAASSIKEFRKSGFKVMHDDKMSNGGNILSAEEEADFDAWFEDGNVEEVEKGVYATQDYQWNNRIKGKEALKKFFAKEYLGRKYATGGKIKQGDTWEWHTVEYDPKRGNNYKFVKKVTIVEIDNKGQVIAQEVGSSRKFIIRHPEKYLKKKI